LQDAVVYGSFEDFVDSKERRLFTGEAETKEEEEMVIISDGEGSGERPSKRHRQGHRDFGLRELIMVPEPFVVAMSDAEFARMTDQGPQRGHCIKGRCATRPPARRAAPTRPPALVARHLSRSPVAYSSY